ncbi:MAG: hypothetical protein ACI4SA_02385 [Lachnospiraceae bacterium]
MSEVYVEHLVKKEKSSGWKFIKILLIMLTVVFGLMGLMMMFYGIPLVIAVATGVGAYFAGLFADVEYEYLYLDKELTVDKIFGKTRRKRAEVFEMERMEVFAPFHSYHLDAYKNRNAKETDYSIGIEQKPDLRYVMYYEGNRRIVFSPNEEMVKALKNTSPRKVFTD